jgi:hypothetical protein
MTNIRAPSAITARVLAPDVSARVDDLHADEPSLSSLSSYPPLPLSAPGTPLTPAKIAAGISPSI